YLTGEYEPEVRAAIKQVLKPRQTAIDIGAHVGHHAATMRQCVGPGGRVLAFEPAPDRFPLLSSNLAQFENAAAYQIGISDKSGAIFLDVSPRTSPSVVNAATPNTIEIETIDLTAAMNRFGIDEIGLVKIDIEGHECKAIQ